MANEGERRREERREEENNIKVKHMSERPTG